MDERPDAVGDGMKSCIGMILSTSETSRAGIKQSEYVFLGDSEVFSVLPDMPSVFIPVQWLPHIERILAFSPALPGGVVRVIIHYPPVDRISHFLVHVDGHRVTAPHVQIDKPGVLLVTGFLQGFCQQSGVALPPVLGGDGQDGDVAVPGQGVWRIGKMRRGGFNLAHDIADDLIMLLNALEQRRPPHEIGQIEVDAVVLGEGIEIAVVQVEEVIRPHTADDGHVRPGESINLT